MNYIDLNGTRVTVGAVSIPYLGAWVADVTLALAESLTSAADGCVLTLGNLQLVGTVVRVASFAGSKSARIVGGAGGWRAPVSAQAYYDPAGVRLSTVLGDAAAAAGETLSLNVADARIGTTYTRMGAPAKASQVLAHLSNGLWYIDAKGVTQVGAARTSRVIASPFTVEHWSGALGRFRVAHEDFASWLPGNTFSAVNVSTPQTVSLVSHRLENDGILRTEILATP